MVTETMPVQTLESTGSSETSAAQVIEGAPEVQQPIQEQVSVATEAPVVKPPEIPIPTSSVVPPEVQQYIAKLEQREQIAQGQENARILDTVVAQYAQKLAQEESVRLQEQIPGIAPEHILPFAQRVAKERANLLYEHYQMSQGDHFVPGQLNAALVIAKETGADPQMLWHLPTPDAMREVAKNMTTQNTQAAKIVALEALVAKLTKASVPAQSFSSAQGAPQGGGNYVQQLKSGGPLPPPDEIDRLTARYLRK